MEKGSKKNILTPKQVKFIKCYTDIGSETFGNGYKSALKAKYTDETAKRLICQLPDRVNQEISRGLSGEEIKGKVIEKLDWLISTLKDPAQRKEMGISVDNCIRSLELLGKWQKLFTDRVEVTGGITVVGYLPGEQGYQQAGAPVIDTTATDNTQAGQIAGGG